MEKKTIYTTGYTGQDIAALQPMLKALNAVLLDVRHSLASRVAHWRGESLRRVLGEDYQHVATLGNPAFREGKLKVANLPAGIRVIEHWLKRVRNVVLMCGCAEYESCHRSLIGNALLDLGYDVEDIEDWAQMVSEHVEECAARRDGVGGKL